MDGEGVASGEEDGDYQPEVRGGQVEGLIRARAEENGPWFISFTPLAPHTEQPEGAANTGLRPPLDSADTDATATTGGSIDEASKAGGPNADAHTEPVPAFRWAFPRPAPRHRGALAAQAQRVPSFGVVGEGKPAAIRDRPELDEATIRLIDQSYQLELATLLAVDEWVARLLDALDETGQLDDTVVIFTSDNGYFHGQFNVAFQKYHLYQPAVQVPLVIRGPGFGSGRVEDVVANVDLAPTIYALAGVEPPVEVDGVDLAALAAGRPSAPGRAVLLENQSQGGAVHAEAVHDGRYVLIEHSTGERELYDVRDDPHQLQNLSGEVEIATLEANLSAWLAVLRTCAGDSCRAPRPQS